MKREEIEARLENVGILLDAIAIATEYRLSKIAELAGIPLQTLQHFADKHLNRGARRHAVVRVMKHYQREKRRQAEEEDTVILKNAYQDTLIL